MQPDHRGVKAGNKKQKNGKASKEANKTSHRFYCNYMQTSTRKGIFTVSVRE